MAASVVLVATATTAQEAPYVQKENEVYGEVHGVGLLMDIFAPRGKGNGLGIVDVISGAWYSDRGKIRDHMRARTFDILCGKGYTAFASRPGSVTKFSAPEMLANLNTGIRWVKEHAKEYGVDAERLGMMGASAGGHLACLAAVTAEDGKADGGKTATSTGVKGGAGETARADGRKTARSRRVKGAAVFFPPTDFLNWGGKAIDLRGDDRFGQLVRRVAVAQGSGNEGAEGLTEKGAE